MPTSGYQAAPETNQSQISYALETAWGVVPAVAFQAIRYTGETLADSKTRNRPGEIINAMESAAAVTTQEQASGAINYALSYGTFDDFFAAAINAPWQTPVVIAGIAGDTTITAGANPTLSSTLSTKFTNLNVGQWIRLFGFTNAGNNGFWRVKTKASNQSITLAGTGTAVTETPAGTAAQVRASTIVNGAAFQSLFVQQQFSSALFLQYPGSYVSGFTLTGGIGQFLSGSFSILAQQEQSAVVNGSTGSVVAAPTGRVHDPVGGFGGFLLNEATVGAVMDSFTLQWTMNGAALEFGMGTSAAQGVIMGLGELKGQVKLYFKDFTLYSRFKAETLGALEFITRDPAGNAYIFTVLNGALMNPNVDSSGPSKAVMVTFDIEGNPQAAGGTIQIDRLSAT